MNFSEKLILAGLAVSLLLLPACERHRRRRTGGGGGGGAELLGKGPGAGHHYGQQNPRDFEVYIYTDPDDPTKCHADIDVATLWTRTKKNGTVIRQTVTWFSDDGKDYTVDFSPDSHYPDKRGSPFQSPDQIYIPAGKSAHSQDLKPDSTGYYAFAIWAGQNLSGKPCKDASDPGYRVSP